MLGSLDDWHPLKVSLEASPSATRALLVAHSVQVGSEDWRPAVTLMVTSVTLLLKSVVFRHQRSRCQVSVTLFA